MIVVAIIGMLAAVAIPSFLHAREKSRMVACVQNLKVIDNSIQLWAMEAKKQAGQPVTFEDIRIFMAKEPICPSGGTSFSDSYQITSIDAAPVCLRAPSGRYPHQM